MVDFKKHLGRKVGAKATDPTEIYKALDRASDKGDLREPQKRILADWHSTRRAERDVILKLHTGQGKTLLGLLMLQSKLNEGKGPALYLCPNHSSSIRPLSRRSSLASAASPSRVTYPASSWMATPS